MRAGAASVPEDPAPNLVKRQTPRGGNRSTTKLLLLWEPLGLPPLLLFSLAQNTGIWLVPTLMAAV